MKKIRNWQKLNALIVKPQMYGKDEAGRYYRNVTRKRDEHIPLMSKMFLYTIVVMVVFSIVRQIMLTQ
jgi:hypothetical protein